MRTRFRFAVMACICLQLLQPAAAQTSPAFKKPKDNLELTVDLSGISYPLEKLFLSYYNTTTKFRFTDSVEVKDRKKVVFKTFLSEPTLAQLRVVPAAEEGNSKPARNTFARDNYSIYIGPGKISVTAKDSLGNATVTGSATHKDYLLLKKQLAEFDPQFASLYAEGSKLRKNKDSVGAAAIRKQIDSLQELVEEKVYKGFVVSHGKRSPVALYALAQYTGYSIDPDKAQPVYNLLGPAVRSLPTAKLFQERIKVARQLQIGKYALEFTQNDTLGVPVSLASFKGKYVLVDFWASWCGPCRAENPNVVRTFQKYKSKDFTVLGVSLDRPGQKDKWLKAIHDDQLDWTHVSDLNFWDNEVARLYDIKAIPQNLLLDKEGKIIAKNVRGEELETTLQQLIK